MTPTELYRLLHVGNEGDVDFYLGVSGKRGRVLELGAGWGRIARELARAGCEVVAVDQEPEFLEVARDEAARTLTTRARERFTTVLSDLRELDLDQKFTRVLLPYNLLYALGGAEQVTRAFRVAERHLARGGQVWFDVYAMDVFHAESLAGETPAADDERELVGSFERDGRVHDVFERTLVDLAAKRLDVDYELECEGRVLQTSRLVHHYLLTTELVACLESAGLEVMNAYGGFSGEPFDDSEESESELFVCGAARKPKR